MKKALSATLVVLIAIATILQVVPYASAEHNPNAYWTDTKLDTLSLSEIVWPKWLNFTIENLDITPDADPIVKFKFVIEKNETGYARFHYEQSKQEFTGWSATPDEFDPSGWPTVIIFESDGTNPIREKMKAWFAVKFIFGPKVCNYKFAIYTIDSGSPPVTKLSWLYLTIDPTPPIVELTYPENNTFVGGDLVWINATAEDTLGIHDTGIQNVTLYLNNTVYEMIQVTPNDFYWHDAPPITEAWYNATAVAFDGAGNPSEPATVFFIWDNKTHPIEIYDSKVDFPLDIKPVTLANLTIYYRWEIDEDPFLRYFEVMDNVTGTWINNDENFNYTFVDVTLGWHRIYVRYFDCALNSFETYIDIEVRPGIQFEIRPTTGTVGPVTTLIDPETGLVAGSMVAVGDKTLGTEVTVEGHWFTANSILNVTVYVPTYDWYYTNYGTYELFVAQATTDDTGNFITSFLFPTAPHGIYRITAKDSNGLQRNEWFTVVPEIAFTPTIVIGPAVIEVKATGLTSNGYVSRFMVDGTDALVGTNLQTVMVPWMTDVNGTLRTLLAEKPGFLMPVMEPGTYEIAIGIYDGDYWDGKTTSWVPLDILEANYLYVVNDFKDLMNAIDALKQKLDTIHAKLISIQGDMVIIDTEVGQIELKLDETIIPFLEAIEAKLDVIGPDILLIKTAIGDVELKLDETVIPFLEAIEAKLVDIEDGIGRIETAIGEIEIQDLSAIEATLTEIDDDIATVDSKLGEVKVSLTDINTKITVTNDNIATIETDIGTIKGRLTSIEGDVATIETDIGTVKVSLDDIEGTTEDIKTDTSLQPATVALSLIAAISAIAAAVMVLRKVYVK